MSRACSSCARTRSPAGGWRRSSIAPSIATGSRCAAAPVDDRRRLPQLPDPAGRRRSRPRMLKDFAFHVVGTEEEARELDREHGARSRSRGARGRAAGGRSWRRRASTARCTRSAPTSIEGLLAGAARRASPRRAAPARPNTSRSSRTGARRPARGPTTSASTCTTCRRSRIGSPRSSAARRASSSAKASARTAGSSARRSAARTGSSVRGRPTRSRSRPYASRSPFEVWVVPRRHDADFARATRRGHRAPPPRRCARSSAGSPRASTARHTTSCSTPRRCRNRSTRPTTGTGRSTRGCARSPGLELGTGLPVNPVSPEDAVEELLGRADGAGGAGAPASMTPWAGGRRVTRACGARLSPSSARCPIGRAPDRQHGAPVVADPLHRPRDPLGRSARRERVVP